MNFNNKSPHGLHGKTLNRFPLVIEEGNEEVNIYWMTQENNMNASKYK
jgi:hypothetical protein